MIRLTATKLLARRPDRLRVEPVDAYTWQSPPGLRYDPVWRDGGLGRG